MPAGTVADMGSTHPRPAGGGMDGPVQRLVRLGMAVIGQRRRPVSRDVRVNLVVRFLALMATVMAVGGALGFDDARSDISILLVSLAAGPVFLAANRWGRSPGLRIAAFNLSMYTDLVTLALLVHLTGGHRSPLLPLVVGWVALGVLSFSGPGALAYTIGAFVTVGVQPFLLHPEHVYPDVNTAALLMPVTVMLIVGVALSLEIAVRRVDTRQQDLWGLALRDQLTGVWNRRAFDRHLAQFETNRRKARTAIAVLDLDHFKRLNDEEGHAAGDSALRAFARVLQEQLRDGDEVFRIGGEEFAVVFDGPDVEGACMALERVRTRLQEERDQGWLIPTFSAGVAEGHLPELIEVADQLMYTAKHAGRDRIEVDGAARTPVG